MILTRSQSAEREGLNNQSDGQNSNGTIQTTQPQSEDLVEYQQPPSEVPQNPDCEQQSVDRETMTESGPVERELIRHERVDF